MPNQEDLDRQAAAILAADPERQAQVRSMFDAIPIRTFPGAPRLTEPEPKPELVKKSDWKGWIAVDLDGTLAKYTSWQGPTSIGEPVPLMLARVKQWLAEGRDVRIYTARVSHNGTEERIRDAKMAHVAIVEWCIVHLGQALPVTNVKDYAMRECWDDRCVQVEPNTGRRVDGRED